MTDKQTIEDLNTLREYFMRETGGTVPACIDEAIRIISEQEEKTKEFSKKLIERIEDHKHKLCDGKTGPINAAYAQAHEHIMELISIWSEYPELL